MLTPNGFLFDAKSLSENSKYKSIEFSLCVQATACNCMQGLLASAAPIGGPWVFLINVVQFCELWGLVAVSWMRLNGTFRLVVRSVLRLNRYKLLQKEIDEPSNAPCAVYMLPDPAICFIYNKVINLKCNGCILRCVTKCFKAYVTGWRLK